MSNFEKEDRYIVIKLKNLTHMQEKHLRACLYGEGIQTVESVVVEHDWPEYHMVWSMLKHRMAGKTVPDFDIWRSADALQQHLTVAEQRLGDAYEWGYGDGQSSPNGYSDKEDRDKCIAELLKPSEEVEALAMRPAGCCCPPKGHAGIWAAAMCPVNFGLRRNLGVK